MINEGDKGVLFDNFSQLLTLVFSECQKSIMNITMRAQILEEKKKSPVEPDSCIGYGEALAVLADEMRVYERNLIYLQEICIRLWKIFKGLSLTSAQVCEFKELVESKRLDQEVGSYSPFRTIYFTPFLNILAEYLVRPLDSIHLKKLSDEGELKKSGELPASQ